MVVPSILWESVLGDERGKIDVCSFDCSWYIRREQQAFICCWRKLLKMIVFTQLMAM